MQDIDGSRVNDYIGGEINDFLDFFRFHVEQQRDFRRDVLQKPRMNDGRGEFDMTHSFSSDFAFGQLDAAPLAFRLAFRRNRTPGFPAGALIVLRRPEYYLAKQAVAFRL